MESQIVQFLMDCSPRKIAKIVILPAIDIVHKRIIAHFEKIKKYGSTYRSKMEELDVSVIKSGVGAPLAAINMEALIMAEVKTIIRLDYCGGIGDNVKIGDVVISPSAIRGDGTTPHYLPDVQDPQIDGDSELTNFIINKFKQSNLPLHIGPVYTHDALFRESKNLITKIKQMGAIAIDMETSVVYTLSKLNNIAATSIMIVTDHPVKNKGIFDMYEKMMMNYSKIIDSLNKSIKLILDGIKEIHNLKQKT